MRKTLQTILLLEYVLGVATSSPHAGLCRSVTAELVLF